MFAWKDENKQKEAEDGSFKKTNFITQVVKIFWDFWAILKDVNLNALAMFGQLSGKIGLHLIPTSGHTVWTIMEGCYTYQHVPIQWTYFVLDCTVQSHGVFNYNPIINTFNRGMMHWHD